MKENLTKYLKILLYLHIASLAKALIGYLPIQLPLSAWISRGIIAGVIYCLFSMAPAGERYRKSAVLRIVFLISGFFNGIFPLLVGSVCSIISSWYEYKGHSELTAEADPKLSQRWSSLFGLELLVSILISVTSAVVSTVLAFMNGSGADTMLGFAVQLPIAAGYILDILYLLYINRTIKLYET